MIGRVNALVFSIMVAASALIATEASADTATRVGSLPTTLAGATAATDGTHGYIFGGWNGCCYQRKVIRFDPVTKSATVVASLQPYGTGLSAIFDGPTSGFSAATHRGITTFLHK